MYIDMLYMIYIVYIIVFFSNFPLINFSRQVPQVSAQVKLLKSKALSHDVGAGNHGFPASMVNVKGLTPG